MPRVLSRPARFAVAGVLAALATVALLLPFGAAAAGPPAWFDAPAAGFSWPLAPPHPVLRQFSAPATPWGPGHRGVDLGGTPGEPVLAAADGIVVFAAHLVDRPVVSVDHPNGLRTTYEPVSPTVAPAQPVRRGQVIGHLQPAHPHCAAPACLHWGVRRGDEYLDPLALVRGHHHVRLLPWRS
ncbi:MAG TPA: peptidoglycan DD-metalloendopeptidase family protein [Actinophytocola sp.]|uniref:M23 family metallopeptidase n=1 Tax=Actinophytocola sp. TaxID=1872138 RepID=UPI002DDDB2FA|nr:peptidoglycan DD-metalloendopeptidase family protein [Actinophytocola sp.]HEV2783502.1 peptidoglycan DD-metalloendopeptidase family protein [Actinophytocola sp.]